MLVSFSFLYIASKQLALHFCQEFYCVTLYNFRVTLYKIENTIMGPITIAIKNAGKYLLKDWIHQVQ